MISMTLSSRISDTVEAEDDAEELARTDVFSLLFDVIADLL